MLEGAFFLLGRSLVGEEHHSAVLALDALIQRRLDRSCVIVGLVTDGAILRDIKDRGADRGAHAGQIRSGLPVWVRVDEAGRVGECSEEPSASILARETLEQ